MNVLLIGYRGSGKTTIGRRLADRLWWNFVDLDERLVARAGKSIRRIFEEDGEAAFRDLESALLQEALAADETVFATGGGVVVREENRRLIRQSGAKVIYLRCEPAELHRRIQADTATAEMRPALTALGGSEAEVAQKLAEREPLYREVMTAELDVTHLTIDEAIPRLARML
jgi:shikimate kinase